MPEFLTLLPPDEARALLLSHLSTETIDSELIEVTESLERVLAEQSMDSPSEPGIHTARLIHSRHI
jgi:molybdopterin biosynthesis enzyme